MLIKLVKGVITDRSRRPARMITGKVLFDGFEIVSHLTERITHFMCDAAGKRL